MFKPTLFAAVLLAGGVLTALELTPSADTAVYAPGETVRFTVSKLPANGRAAYRVIDFDRKTVRSGETAPGNLEFTGLPRGWYELQAETVGNAGEKARYPFAVIPEFDRSQTDWEKNQFGVMVAPHTRYPLAHRDFDAKFMERIGVRWVRTHRLNWIQIQPDEHKAPDWATADREVEIYKKRGLSIVATTAWPFPAWASSGRGTQIDAYYLDKMFPADKYIEQTKKFHTELARRYGDKVDYWEIGNEIDAENFWIGRYKHQGDKAAIMQDYIEFYIMIAKALRAGAPAAKIGPNTTGSAPDGNTYRDWLNVFLQNPEARKQMDYFSTHYFPSVPEIRKVLARYGKGDVDIIFTEIGGMAHSYRKVPTWEETCRNIRITCTHYATQLQAGGKALCKFLLRDIPELPPQGWIAGMLEGDFKLRPEYVAFATLIREIGDADPAGRINITRRSDKGWLHGFRFRRGGKTLTLVILNDAPKAAVTLDSASKELRVIDMMGRETTQIPQNGKLVLEMDSDRPLLIEGDISGEPGEGRDPEPVLIQEINVTCNGDFEMPVRGSTIPYWHLGYDTGKGTPEQVGFLVSVDDKVKHSGRQALKIHAEKRTGFYAVCHTMTVPKLKLGQYMVVTYRWWAKGEKIDSIDKAGFAPSLSMRRKDNSRIHWRDGDFERGTFDWMAGEQVRKYEQNDFPPDFNHFSLEFYLGKSTGTLWLDDVSINIKVMQRGASEARYLK